MNFWDLIKLLDEKALSPYSHMRIYFSDRITETSPIWKYIDDFSTLGGIPLTFKDCVDQKSSSIEIEIDTLFNVDGESLYNSYLIIFLVKLHQIAVMENCNITEIDTSCSISFEKKIGEGVIG